MGLGGGGRLLQFLHRLLVGMGVAVGRQKDGVFIKHLRTDTAAVSLRGGGLVVGRVTVEEGLSGRNSRQGHQ